MALKNNKDIMALLASEHDSHPLIRFVPDLPTASQWFPNIFKDIFGAIRDIVGGRAEAWEQELARARDIAFREIEAEAKAIGANAIVGIDIDYEVIGGRASMMMVSVSGTAVRIK